MKKICLLLILLFVVIILSAAPVSEAIARHAAQSWISEINPNPERSYQIRNIAGYNHSKDDDAGFYLISLEPEGFVIVSSDDLIKPILGYSLKGAIVDINLADNLRMFLEEYSREISAIKSKSFLKPHPEWDMPAKGKRIQQKSGKDVAPLTTTTWNHTFPYNTMCPPNITYPGTYVNAGCFAAAMAQLLKYWAFPIHGVGSNSYNLNPWGLIYADFANTTYNYAAMPNNLTNTPNDEISRLTFHVGVAANMTYSMTGSGTSPNNVRNGLINHFNYSEEAIIRDMINVGNDGLIYYTKMDLDLNRIVIHYGMNATSSASHSWLIDGYTGNNYFHINWGWSGQYDGYFYLHNLNPGSYNFTRNRGGIFNLHPNHFVEVPQNLTGAVYNFNCVRLQWESVNEVNLRGYSIYRDGSFLTTVLNPQAVEYSDTNLSPGIHTYYIRAVTNTSTSAPSNTVQVTTYTPPIINFQDGFETYSDFGVIPFPWHIRDLDLASTRHISGYDFPNEGNPASFITFRPLYTMPPNYDITTHSGIKMAACFGAVNTSNNDWLISPLWNSGSISQFKFWAKSEVGSYSNSLMKVGYTQNLENLNQMVFVSGSTPVNVPSSWTEYVFDFPNLHHQNLYIGINCVSSNGYILLIDDIQLITGDTGTEECVANNRLIDNLNVSPNPARSEAKISFTLSRHAQIKISVYDIKGRKIKILLVDRLNKGTHSTAWDGSLSHHEKAAAGVYIIKLECGSEAVTKKLTVLN